MPEEKLQIGIYKINTESTTFEEGNNSLDTLADKIIEEDSRFEPQEIKDDSVSDFTMKILYKRNSTSPKWKDFLKGVVKDGQDILKDKQSWLESFVLLIETNEAKNLYAITGGLLGFFAIQDYTEDDFGVEILSRLIDKDDKILKSVREKSVMGGVLGTTKFFRNNYNLHENDSFGKIYQELQAHLDKEILTEHFGFSFDELTSDAVCVAKTSFRINKAITFAQILKIISGCEYVLQNLDPITINSVKKVVKKKEPALIQELEDKLFNQLWQRFHQGSKIDFDLCHKDFEKYLTAHSYIIRKNYSKNNFFDEHKFEELKNIDGLFDRIRELEGGQQNEDEFRNLLKSLKIYTYSEEDENNPLTKGWLYNHLFGDVPLNDKTYFLIDNNWYRVEDVFTQDLNEACSSFINNNYDTGLGRNWNLSDSENDYNKTYIGEANTLVLDKITPKNIEPCDVLKWDDENLYFYHVKAGFGNTMRDLCSQVFIAANKIKKDLADSKEYWGKTYDLLVNKKSSDDPYFIQAGGQTDSMSKIDFLELPSNRKLVFVLAVSDTAQTERSLQTHINNFNSNIAKFSLQELVKGMRGIEVEFKFTQISRNNI